MSKHKAKKQKETAGELSRELISQVSSAIKALNLPAGSGFILRRCDCRQRTIFLYQAQRKLGRGMVRELTALAGRLGLNFSTQLVCPECSAKVGGDTRREIIHTESKTVERDIPLAILNPDASEN